MTIERTINVADVRAKLSELTSDAYFKGDRFIVERRGVPMAVLLGIEDYRDLVRVRKEEQPSVQDTRRRLALEMDALRKRIGPLPLRVADLVNEARKDSEDRYDETRRH